MKIVQEKPEFSPISIILETRHEAEAFAVVFRMLKDNSAFIKSTSVQEFIDAVSNAVTKGTVKF